jgi:hypothetical protein
MKLRPAVLYFHVCVLSVKHRCAVLLFLLLASMKLRHTYFFTMLWYTTMLNYNTLLWNTIAGSGFKCAADEVAALAFTGHADAGFHQVFAARSVRLKCDVMICDVVSFDVS